MICRKLETAQSVLADHKAAVKALAWCPWQRRMLASGGGDGDCQVRLWDTKTGSQMSSFDAKAAVWARPCCYVSSAQRMCTALLIMVPSVAWHCDRCHVDTAAYHPLPCAARYGVANLQVGALVWNPHEKELLGGLGYPDFQVALWRYPTCQLMGEFHGHEQRILQLAISPDQCTICTCAFSQRPLQWTVPRLHGALTIELPRTHAVPEQSCVAAYVQLLVDH